MKRHKTNSLESIYNSARVGLCVLDRELRYVRINKYLAEIVGKKPEDLIGKTVQEVIPSIVSQVEEMARQILNTGEPVLDFETSGTSPDKPHEQRHFLNQCLALRDADGNVTGFNIVVQDITGRKQAEEKARAACSMLLRVMNNIPQGVFWKNCQSVYLGCNDVFAKAVGLKSPEFISGMTDYDLCWSPEQVEWFRHQDRKIMEADAPEYHIIEQQREADGRLAWVETNKIPLHDEQGNVTGILGTYEDITDRKRIEEDLRKLKEGLESLVVERTAQLSNLNESLIAEIKEHKRTETQLIAAQKKLRAMASKIVLSEERSRLRIATELHNTVVQTLGAAKLRAQLIEHEIPKKVKPIFTDLQAMLSDSILQSRFIMTEMSPPVLNELGLISALEWLTEQIGSRYGMNISFKSKEHDKTLMLPRDVEVLFFQVTRELLMNVVKHSNAQRATVKFSSDNQKVKIEVSDNGIGFDIRKTFQPDKESGFGLYCIREWLRHIGGVMTIESRSGEGTKVLISAPREFEK